MLEIGTKAPAFSLQDQNGEVHSLSDYKGQKVILYFYPKDMTGGCTSQACNFRDRYPQFQEKGAVVLGVSKRAVMPSSGYLLVKISPIFLTNKCHDQLEFEIPEIIGVCR